MSHTIVITSHITSSRLTVTLPCNASKTNMSTTKYSTYHKVIPTSFPALFRHKEDPVEHDRRTVVARQVVRYATRQVAEINTLSNMLMQLFLIHLINHNLPVPLRLSDQNQTLWNWCTSLCSTLDGQHTAGGPKAHKKYERNKNKPVSEEMEAKKKRKRQVIETQEEEKEAEKPRKKKKEEPERLRAKKQKECIKETLETEMEHQHQLETFHRLKHVFDTQMMPLIPHRFVWPDRAGLSDIMHAENAKRRTCFNNMYGRTLLTRQSKVIRAQISLLPTLQQLDLEEKPAKAIRYLCTRYVQYHVNRWPWTANFLAIWNKHAGDVDHGPAMHDLEQLINEHQAAFGPNDTWALHQPYYRLSEEDASSHAACYVYYFHYLAQQYAQYANGEIPGKWQAFSVIPQTSQKMPFIDISAKAVVGLVALSRKKKVQDHVVAQLSLYRPEDARDEQTARVMEAVRAVPCIDWLKCGEDDHRVTTTWAQAHQQQLFDLLFSPSWRGILKKTDKSKHQQYQFECMLSTDGQQARLHVSTRLLVQTDDEQEKMETTTVTRDKFESWIAERKQLISVDPGHRDLICGVRHGDCSEENHESIISLPPPTSCKGKLKRARQQREAEAHQSVYKLSNKRYYDMCGFTAANASRHAWRGKAGLSANDLYLSQNVATCSSRTWHPNVYSSYVQFICSRWQQLWEEVSQAKYQKLRFRVFQRQERAYHTIAHEISHGRPRDTMLLWGAGSFGPTSKGHAAAPNKKLRKKLCDCGLEIALVDEWGTTKHTACCLHHSVFVKQRQAKAITMIGPIEEPKKERVRGLLYCKSETGHHPISPFVGYLHHHANGYALRNEVVVSSRQTSRPWNRDVSAAINIFHRAFHECHGAVPLCFARPRRDEREDR